MRAYSIEGDVIVLHRELTELDRFVKQFLDVLKKHSDYLIVSGYVSIATGRTRGTEDVDVLVPLISYDTFKEMFADTLKNGFWCYQGDTATEIYEYIKDKQRPRFARLNEMFPNIEFITIDETDNLQFFEFKNPQTMRVDDFEFKVPPIEFEILYKEQILRSPKDIADARHLRTLFSDFITEAKFKIFEHIITDQK